MEKSYYQKYVANQWMFLGILPCLVNALYGKINICFILITIINLCILIFLRNKWKHEQTKNAQLLYISTSGIMISILLFTSWIRILLIINGGPWIILISSILYAFVIIFAILISLLYDKKKNANATKIMGGVEIFAAGGSVLGFSLSRSMSKSISQNQAYFVIGLCLYVIALLTALNFMAIIKVIRDK